MIHITLSPQLRPGPLSLASAGSTLILDGAAVDLASCDAETAPHPLIAGQSTAVGGDWQVALILPHGPDAPHEARFSAPIAVTEDGPVELPAFGA